MNERHQVVFWKIDPIHSSCSYERRKETKAKLKTQKEQLFGESSCSESHACKSKCQQLNVSSKKVYYE